MDLLIGIYQDSYWISRFLICRGLGLVYLLAFVNALNQFIPLLGENGLLPLPGFLKRMSFKERPSIFHWHYSDRYFRYIAWIGIILSLFTISGLSGMGPFWLSMFIWLLLWILYMSIVNAGVVFYGFGWESMLLEAGFYAIFLGPMSWGAPVLVVWMFRWMLFRVEFGAGLIKIRGDQCWRDLTCMNYHHETQPLPNPVSRFAHNLPQAFHKMETFVNLVIQLVVVWGLFFPQPIAAISAVLILLSQGYLVITGNYSWLNFLTIILAFSGFSDETFSTLFSLSAPVTSALPLIYMILIIILSLTVIYLSIRPVRNMISSHQMMNFSFNPIHLVNTYGAFGSVTKQRFEIIIEGTRDTLINEETEWKEYEFKGKPGDLKQRPKQIAPYHLRLDWQLWFAAMAPTPVRSPWFKPLLFKLLQNDAAVLKLLSRNPFPDDPPKWIRARRYLYRYTSFEEQRKTGRWWNRKFVSEYMQPVSL